METLADRARRVVERVRAAELRAGRAEGSVTLCAVSKTFPAEAVAEAAAAGITEVGENRVQEAEGKRPEAERLGAAGLRWHLIGHLQSNKARKAVETFEVIQTVDSVALVDRLDRIAGEAGRRIDVYVQVDLGHEPTKTGAVEADVAAIVERLGSAGNLAPVGLMTIPPFFENPEEARPYFRRLRAIAERHAVAGLSMGMSHDFEVAIEEGATLVRVGTAIFGHR
jgi:pyridoxal phosphate enzyme (YggS family)